MYSWLHFSLATACALIAWYSLYRAPAQEAERADVTVG
jgi:alpha-1,6-mannosyltransferase